MLTTDIRGQNLVICSVACVLFHRMLYNYSLKGSWETKISNREKRQQRKKEKGASDDSGSPGGGDHAGQQTEQPVVTAPVNTKKNKGKLYLYFSGSVLLHV